MVELKTDRPPFVTFELRAEEDRQASLAAGHYVAKDVAYALITPMGSKDRIERIAEDWFLKLREDVAQGRFPLEWLRHFEQHFKSWQDGLEPPVNGTPLERWNALSPAQLKNLRGLHLRTVEDMAQANEEVIARIGMGGRALKQQAEDFLKGSGVSGELSALRADNENLRVRNESLEKQLKELTVQVQRLVDKPAAKAA